jgi:hypothetical protein
MIRQHHKCISISSLIVDIRNHPSNNRFTELQSRLDRQPQRWLDCQPLIRVEVDQERRRVQCTNLFIK